MKRYHQEQHIIAKRRALAQSFHTARRAAYVVPRTKTISYRKRHPLDCGNPRCGICHSDKRFGHEETRQEAISRLKLDERN
jgi:hypothetical protein